MPAAAIGVAGSIGSALIGSAGASQSAGQIAEGQAWAINERDARFSNARDFLDEWYQKSQGFLSPYTTVGQGALADIAQLFGLPGPGGESAGTPGITAAYEKWRETPEYQMPLQEGLKAVEYSQVGKAGVRNPVTLGALQDYGQRYASSRLDQYVAKLFDIAGMGRGAATSLAQGALSTGTNLARTEMQQGNLNAQNMANIGQASAAGTAGAYGAWGQATNDITASLASAPLFNPAPQSALTGPSYNAPAYYMGGSPVYSG